LKLRLLQLKADKTALFFCYILPVLLLLGIGYPLQTKGKPTIALTYSDHARNEASAALVRVLQGHALVRLELYAQPAVPAAQALASNDVKHHLELRAEPTVHSGFVANLYANSLPENLIENTALRAIVDASLSAVQAPVAQLREVPTTRYSSYLVTLLPGIIGMTLLIIGLNGFGSVLIEEEHHGLYKSIKTIDASPLPFLGGLFVSRMLVAYSVAAALLLISAWVFGIPTHVNYPLLLLVVTLGCVAFLGLGLLLATLSPSVAAFNGIVSFVQIPCIMLGGVFFSVSTFPDWLQFFTALMPLTQLNTAMREMLFDPVKFHGIAQLYPEIAGLSAWSAITLVIARLRFRW
jgi:ABC-type multidrug transport system permease subunit